MDKALAKAIKAAGGAAALAVKLRITKQAVGAWKRVPPGRVLEVERLTGVSRHALRPDIYGPHS
jgi:DNA-binding transcriptional regulator YdaS (Cro superfamily)